MADDFNLKHETTFKISFTSEGPDFHGFDFEVATRLSLLHYCGRSNFHYYCLHSLSLVLNLTKWHFTIWDWILQRLKILYASLPSHQCFRHLHHRHPFHLIFVLHSHQWVVSSLETSHRKESSPDHVPYPYWCSEFLHPWYVSPSFL